jgi:hypothetical protein
VDELDLVFLPEAFDSTRERLGDLLAAAVQRLPVEADVACDHAEVLAVAGVVVELGRAQDRLRRDAGIVEAAPAGFVALDDRGLLAQLGGADGGYIAARAPADDDLVEGVGHAPGA